DDWKKLNGRVFRLKGFANVKLSGKTAVYTGNELKKSMQKIQWASKPNIRVELVVPDGDRVVIRKGVAEPAMTRLRPGAVIQMERMGFGRVDAVEKNRVVVYWGHK
ncbi:MAG: hypothetical protein DRN95_09040, partial [Candidatus Hydrothermarchaeota archaeon]